MKPIMEKKILVPTDFTKVGDAALEHAMTVGKALRAEVNVLHVISNKKDISEANLKLDTLAARMKKEYSTDIKTIARIGSIFDDIDKVATEIGASLIIMGTHGMKGMQFITGSKALKIVTESTIPFIIVQERGIRDCGYDRIVVPLDLHKETKQKLKLVSSMANYFESKIYLVSPGEKDEFLKNKLDRNLAFAKTFLKERDIDFEVEILKSKSRDFAKSMLKYASSIDADLICIMNFYENSLMGIIGGNYEQHIITNEAQVPVLSINPVETTVIGGTVFNS